MCSGAANPFSSSPSYNGMTPQQLQQVAAKQSTLLPYIPTMPGQMPDLSSVYAKFAGQAKTGQLLATRGRAGTFLSGMAGQANTMLSGPGSYGQGTPNVAGAASSIGGATLGAAGGGG